MLPPWDELKQDLPEGFDGTMTCDWPYPEPILNIAGVQQTERKCRLPSVFLTQPQ